MTASSFLCRMGSLRLTDSEQLTHPEGAWKTAGASLCGKEHTEMVQASNQDASRAPSLVGFPGTPR